MSAAIGEVRVKRTVTMDDMASMSRCRPSIDADELNTRFESCEPLEVIEWATTEFGDRVCVTTSFADLLLIDLATSVNPGIEVVFVDTGHHFPETLEIMREALHRYSLNLTVVRPPEDSVDFGTCTYDECCQVRKVEPFNRYLIGSTDAWMSGLRRDDSSERSTTPVVQIDRNGLVKLNPLTLWSTDQLDGYMARRGILVNPLTAEGYSSIGCMPCTAPTDSAGSDKRAGRWMGSSKTECGIHLPADRG